MAASRVKSTAGTAKVAKKQAPVLQFKITLLGITPVIWRRIQVPDGYSFWDLHVAIQDTMGWLDCHLHAFRVPGAGPRDRLLIGIPDEDDPDAVQPGWQVPLRRHFVEPGTVLRYTYDYGDSWKHEVLLEQILLPEPGTKCPRCLAGERACPPEDCGGISGYERVVRVLQSAEHSEHRDTIAWLRNHPGHYDPYLPDAFTPETVKFDNPKKRWRQAFS